MNQKGFSAILIAIALVTHTAVFTVGYQLGKSNSANTNIKDTVNESPQVNTSSSATDWQEYQTDKFSMSYPPNWLINNYKEYQGQQDKVVSFSSNDYKSNAAGLPGEGIIVEFRIGWRGFSSDRGLKSSEEVDWLGNKATLNIYKAEGNDLVLHTNIDGVDYEMVMFAPSDEVRDLNKETFLKVANSITLK